MSEGFRLVIDGAGLEEGARVDVAFDLTMTRFTPPELVDFTVAAYRASKGRGELIAVELAPDDICGLLGSLYRVHVELMTAPLGIVVLWDGLELRTNQRLGRQRFMPIFRCKACGGRGRVHRAAIGREEPCVSCRGTGERRGF